MECKLKPNEICLRLIFNRVFTTRKLLQHTTLHICGGWLGESKIKRYQDLAQSFSQMLLFFTMYSKIVILDCNKKEIDRLKMVFSFSVSQQSGEKIRFLEFLSLKLEPRTSNRETEIRPTSTEILSKPLESFTCKK